MLEEIKGALASGAPGVKAPSASCEKVGPVFRQNDALIQGAGIGSIPKVQIRFSRPMLEP
ncbi:hypothetical protein [Microvirga sp. M2]|uniref:hypothetical protein n=1 Tax=Microvirga sp. M2 TaxID=3073270 RepID=UPI0039C06DAF